MSKKPPLMKCGHVAQGEDGDGNPVCIICIGIKEGAREVDPHPPELKGRMAECTDCGKTVESSYDLPFFAHYPDREKDSYYCGCWGWD